MMPARLGPTRPWPVWSEWQIPQLLRNSRSPSSSARAPSPKQMSTKVRASTLTAAISGKKVCSSCLLIRLPHQTVKDILTHQVLTDLRSRPAFRAKFKAVLCGSDQHTPSLPRERSSAHRHSAQL